MGSSPTTGTNLTETQYPQGFYHFWISAKVVGITSRHNFSQCVSYVLAHFQFAAETPQGTGICSRNPPVK